ncbi:MAG TPA: menaquinone biosynthesis decarboxylase [Bacteroidales bacterium]|nr:menaquinone biosynthesis decarboxylase [Bacteroidales bacterium]
MPLSGLTGFISSLEKANELLRIREFVDPLLEITEITDRITKSGGKALLFENNGTRFPVLINAFGSEKRMAMALGRNHPEEIAEEITELFNELTGRKGSLFEKIRSLPRLLKISGYFPAVSRGRGECQQIIHRDPDLNILPVLKCWPHDGGRFITLPVVHTVNPVTRKTNAGMYRMQILDNKRTAMHWQRHKTGASHFEEWKKTGRKMPVTVTLGGDPVYTYSATAPLPENVDEYILAGFLRKKKVKLVKCLTNELAVPSDADIVIEGYVDPSEAPVLEGPFGDHTGFYSLADWYPAFHITCITHRKDAVYPATIVGIPPQEDAWLTRATEKIFLAPLRLALQPETEDFHMPDAGVAHNLVIVKIRKTYPGQGKKVISALFGAGQMMFTKYLVVVSGDVDIRNYRELLRHVIINTGFRKDFMFAGGPLDVLDHAADTSSTGGKLGIDATIKFKEESSESHSPEPFPEDKLMELQERYKDTISSVNLLAGYPVIAAGIKQYADPAAVEKAKNIFSDPGIRNSCSLVLISDDTVDISDWFMVVWQVLGNTDPGRDLFFLSDNTLFIDGTIKAFSQGGFTRIWPNIVCSGEDTIKAVDMKWKSLGIGPVIPSPSLKNRKMVHGENAEIRIAGK